MKDLPPPELLRKLLRYDPETGKLFWLNRPLGLCASKRAQNTWNTKFSGKEAFKAKKGSGYLTGAIFDRTFLAHRIIWAISTGAWPVGEIDHINGVRSDNSIENLREVTRSENSRNMKKYSCNTSGVNGVSWNRQAKKWVALIKAGGRQEHLGYFDNIADAAEARRAAEAGLGFTDRHGA